MTRMCSKTYRPLPALGCPGAQTMTYPALWRVRPPFQQPFEEPATVRQLEQVVDFPCFRSPQEHRSRDRHAGQRRCPLDGWNSLPHSRQVRIAMFLIVSNTVSIH